VPDLERRTYWHCQSAETWQATVGKHTVSWGRMPPGAAVQFDWQCSCPSFRFRKGTDERGYCKHVRAVIEEQQRCGWMQFSDGGEPVKGDEGYACPECGNPAFAMEWGV
jgi:hypothetical protein